MHILAKELLSRTDLKAAYMPQNYEELLDLAKTPVEFLSDGSRQSISTVRTYLGSMKFTADEMMHPMRELSGGQRAKIMLLYLDTSGCNVLLLDRQTATSRHCPILSSGRCLLHLRASSSACPTTANILPRFAAKCMN